MLSCFSCYVGKDKKKTLVLEAICDPDLYIWYFFFGLPGSLNDINVLDKSSIVGAMIRGTFNIRVPPYKIHERERDWMYFLVDGIYPGWAIFAKTNPEPITDGEKLYKKRHEHVRKDIERCFGVLVKKFGILERPIRNWYLEDIQNILKTCVILHNMTVVERREAFQFNDIQEGEEEEGWGGADEMEEEEARISLFHHNAEDIDVDMANNLAARAAHMSVAIEGERNNQILQEDLTKHIWRRSRRGRNNDT